MGYLPACGSSEGRKTMNINNYKDGGIFIRRSDAVKAIEAWADKNKGKEPRKPDIVARLMATKVEAIKSVEVDPAYYTSLKYGFRGMNISQGECGNCGAKLIWKTNAPINGCPYCFFRFEQRGGK